MLALVLRKGFGREPGDKDLTYVGGKKGIPRIQKRDLEDIVWRAHKYESGASDPEFRARLIKHKTDEGIRQAAAERAVRETLPNLAAEQAHGLVSFVLKKENWGRYRRKSRVKKKSPPPA